MTRRLLTAMVASAAWSVLAVLWLHLTLGWILLGAVVIGILEPSMNRCGGRLRPGSPGRVGGGPTANPSEGERPGFVGSGTRTPPHHGLATTSGAVQAHPPTSPVPFGERRFPAGSPPDDSARSAGRPPASLTDLSPRNPWRI